MPQISAIVPARNEEENIAAAVSSLAAQPEVAEIIAVDDQSADRTPEILKQLAAETYKLKILRNDALPAGWTGKNYAVWRGAEIAACEWLLFTDADTILLSGAARAALDDAQKFDAALVSYSPQQITEGVFERALIPFIYCRLSRKFAFERVNDPASPDAAANGQFLMIRRAAYNAVGGHESVAGEVLEDVALARRVKAAGFRLHFAPGGGIARTRMYRNFGALWHGWTKNLYALSGGTFKSTARELALLPWVELAVIIAGICVRNSAGDAMLALGLAGFLLRHILYARELIRNRYPAKFIVYYGLGVPLYAAILVSSAWKYRRGSVSWKGRKYAVSPAEKLK